MPENQNLKKVIDWLKSQGIVTSQAHLAEALGYNVSYLSQVVSGKKEVSKKLALEIAGLSKKVNPDYLLEENASMLLDSCIEDYINKVPYYDIDVTATITTSFSDVKETPEFYVDFKPFNDCLAYLPIYGDSMYPKYKSGEIIAIKEITNKDVIQWGEAYLIITNSNANNMRTVKLVHPCNGDKSKLILKASNPNFAGDTIVSKDDIVSMYIIKGKITREQM